MEEPRRRSLSACWSESLFPGPGGPVRVTRAAGLSLSRRGTVAGLAAVTGLAAVLLFLRMSCPLREPDEARPAEAARRMLANGYAGAVASEEDGPLHAWVVLGSYRLLGVHDWAARLPSAVVGLLTVLATGLWGWRLFGPRTALVAAALLALSARFIFLGRLVAPDGLVGLTVLSSLALGHAALDRPAGRPLGWRTWLASATAAGLGWLAGGPVVLVAVVLAVAAFAHLDRRAARPSVAAWAAYAAVALAVSLPWLAGLAVATVSWKPQAVTGAPSVVLSLAALATGMLPWTLLWPVLLGRLTRRSPGAAAERPPALGFVLLSLSVVLGSCILMGGPGARRLMPVLPLAALALAVPLMGLLTPGRTAGWAAFAWGGKRGAGLLAVRGTQVALGSAALLGLAASLAGLVSSGYAAALAAAAGLAGLALAEPLRRQRPATAWTVCGLTTLLVLLALVDQVLPGYHRRLAVRGQARAVAEAIAGSGGETTLPVVCYPRRFDSVGFYLGRDDVRAFTAAEKPLLLEALRDRTETLLFVESGPALEDVLADLPPGMEFIRRGRVGLVTAGTVRYRPEPPATLLARFW